MDEEGVVGQELALSDPQSGHVSWLFSLGQKEGILDHISLLL